MTDFSKMEFLFPGDNLPDMNFFNTNEVVTGRSIKSSRVMKADLKHERLSRLKREAVEAIFPRMPEAGECFHVISNGGFDFWTLAAHIIESSGRKAMEFYGSTWIMNQRNAQDLLRLCDFGILSKVTVITGDYMQRRSPGVFATIAEGLMSRGHAMKTAKNHAKVILVSDGKDYNVSIEGSANWCHNENIEQYQITNDRSVYEFHREWMQELAG